MPKVQRERLFLKWAPKNKRDGIGSKAANSEISLVKVRNIIGGHEGSGLFRSGSTGEGVVLLQVKLDWNPKFKKNGKIYISNTPKRISKAKRIIEKNILPAVEKDPSKGKSWRFSGYWKLVCQTFDPKKIYEEVGKRSEKKTGKCFDVGCIQTWEWVGWSNCSPQQEKIQGAKWGKMECAEQENVEGVDDELTEDDEEEIVKQEWKD